MGCDIWSTAIHDFEVGNFQQAKKGLAKIIRADGSRGDAFLFLGKIFHREGNFQKALVCFRKSEALDNHLAELFSWMGESLFENKEYKEAKQKLTRAIEIDSELLAPYLSLARLLIEVDSLSKALSFIQGTARKFPDQAEVWYLLAFVYYRRQDHEGTVSAAGKSIAINPDSSPQAYLLKAEGLLALGRVSEALIAFKRSAKIYPLSELYFPLATAYQLQQKFVLSIRIFDKALGLTVNVHRRDEILVRQGIMLSELGDMADERNEKHTYHQQAIEKFQDALAINPGFVAAEHNVAQRYFKLSLHRKSLQILEGLLDKEEGDSMSRRGVDPIIDQLDSRFLQLVHYGYALSLEGRYPEAIKVMQQALATPEISAELPWKCQVLRRLGIIYMESERYLEAEDVWSELAAFDQDNFYDSSTFLREAQSRIKKADAKT